MTLIERFTQISIMIGPNHRTKVTEGEASIMEDIAEEFAIEFAEWLLIIYNEDIIYDAYSKEELLEIYKKEKEL